MGTGPDPKAARTPAEFVAQMRQLRSWSDLSYRQLERKANDAGDVLPRTTIAGVLAREDLPREGLLAAFVRACDGDAVTVEAWLDARRRLVMRMEPAAPEGASEAAGGPPVSKGDEHDEPDVMDGTAAETESVSGTPGSTPSGGTIDDTSTGTESSTSAQGPEGEAPGAATSRSQPTMPSEPGERTSRHHYVPMALTGVCVAVGVLVLAFWPSGDKPSTTQPRAKSSTTAGSSDAAPSTSSPSVTPSSPSPASSGGLASGWWRIHPAGGPYLCLQSDEILIVSRKCSESSQAEAYLESLGDSTYRVQFREGDSRICWGALRSSTQQGMGLVREPCTDQARSTPPNQRLRLERMDSGNYRLRLLHSGLCAGLAGYGEGASLRQAKCDGLGRQEFEFSKT